MSEGIGEDRLEAEGELSLARLALDNGELAHAAKHVANAIGCDPTLRAAYSTLDELASAAAGAVALVPVDGTPHAGMVAVRSYLMARSGQAEGSAIAAIMLGYALRNAGRKLEAHDALLRALHREPDNVNLRVDIAEFHAERGELVKGIGVLDEALALAPDHPKAFPSSCYMRYAGSRRGHLRHAGRHGRAARRPGRAPRHDSDRQAVAAGRSKRRFFRRKS